MIVAGRQRVQARGSKRLRSEFQGSIIFLHPLALPLQLLLNAEGNSTSKAARRAAPICRELAQIHFDDRTRHTIPHVSSYNGFTDNPLASF